MEDKELTLQVLCVSMNQKDFSLIEKMNIQSDAIIGNQCDREETLETEINGHKITYISRNERGVGLNRNTILLKATSDIVLFSDDDVHYEDGYEKIVLDTFKAHPEADVITFNVIPLPETIPPDLNTKWHRVRFLNCLKYGAPRIAVRLKSLREKDIYFSLLFGGGAKYSSGEDSLFMAALLRNKLKVYGAPYKIGTVTFETTWFKGYNEKYFIDKGLFFYFLTPKHYKIMCLQYCIRKRGLFKEFYSWKKAYKTMLNGVKLYKQGKI